MIELEQWMSWRAEEDQRLYEQYGKPLEKEYTGEFVAIGADGQTILGRDDNEVFRMAMRLLAAGTSAYSE